MSSNESDLRVPDRTHAAASYQGRVSRTTGSGWDPYTRFLLVPILKVVLECRFLYRYLLFPEKRNQFNFFFNISAHTFFIH